MDVVQTLTEHLEVLHVNQPVQGRLVDNLSMIKGFKGWVIDWWLLERSLVQAIYFAAAAQSNGFQLVDLCFYNTSPELVGLVQTFVPKVSGRLQLLSTNSSRNAWCSLAVFVQQAKQISHYALNFASNKNMDQFYNIFDCMYEKLEISGMVAILSKKPTHMQLLAQSLEFTPLFRESSSMLKIAMSVNLLNLINCEQLSQCYYAALQKEEQLVSEHPSEISNFLKTILQEFGFEITQYEMKLPAIIQRFQVKTSGKMHRIEDIRQEENRDQQKTNIHKKETTQTRLNTKMQTEVASHKMEIYPKLLFEVYFHTKQRLTVSIQTDAQTNIDTSDGVNFALTLFPSYLSFYGTIIAQQPVNKVHFRHTCDYGNSPLSILLKTMDMLIIGKVCLEKDLTKVGITNIQARASHFYHYWSIFSNIDYSKLRLLIAN